MQRTEQNLDLDGFGQVSCPFLRAIGYNTQSGNGMACTSKYVTHITSQVCDVALIRRQGTLLVTFPYSLLVSLLPMPHTDCFVLRSASVSDHCSLGQSVSR